MAAVAKMEVVAAVAKMEVVAVNFQRFLMVS